MSLDNKPLYTGGCQCGAVRFRVEGALGRPSICHCRMCQKAFGAFYAPLVNVEADRLTWTRGGVSRFRSSDVVQRGFCSACGTPLTYEAPDGTALAIRAFDDPSGIAPVVQFGLEAKIGCVDRLHELPVLDSTSDQAEPSFLSNLVSYQHPDHDTDPDWNPKP